MVGNLPYSTTDEELRRHFSQCSMKAMRHVIDAETQQSKGFAFLEFDDLAGMEQCHSHYHRSIFYKGTRKARKINVEAT